MSQGYFPCKCIIIHPVGSLLLVGLCRSNVFRIRFEIRDFSAIDSCCEHFHQIVGERDKKIAVTIVVGGKYIASDLH